MWRYIYMIVTLLAIGCSAPQRANPTVDSTSADSVAEARMLSLLDDLGNAVAAHDSLRTDSMMSVCRQLLISDARLMDDFIPALVDATAATATANEMYRLLTAVDSGFPTNSTMNFFLAAAYAGLGRSSEAWAAYYNSDFVEMDMVEALTRKASIMEAVSHLSDIEQPYRSFASAIDRRRIDEIQIRQAAWEKEQELKMRSQEIARERRLILWYGLTGLLALTLALIWLYHRSRLARTRHQLIEESQRLRMAELEAEADRLTRLLSTQKELTAPVEDAIKSRIEMLNAHLAMAISTSDVHAHTYEDWKERLLTDKDAFMDSTRLALNVSHPRFIDYLEKHDLSPEEINFLCLYAIGLRGKEAGAYVRNSRHYHISSDIRRKLGLDEHSTNLDIYIRRLMKTL